jgi:hypothetical protein
MSEQAEAHPESVFEIDCGGAEKVQVTPAQMIAVYTAAKELAVIITDHYHHEAANPYPRRIAEAVRGLEQILGK